MLINEGKGRGEGKKVNSAQCHDVQKFIKGSYLSHAGNFQRQVSQSCNTNM